MNNPKIEVETSDREQALFDALCAIKFLKNQATVTEEDVRSTVLPILKEDFPEKVLQWLMKLLASILLRRPEEDIKEEGKKLARLAKIEAKNKDLENSVELLEWFKKPRKKNAPLIVNGMAPSWIFTEDDRDDENEKPDEENEEVTLEPSSDPMKHSLIFEDPAILAGVRIKLATFLRNTLSEIPGLSLSTEGKNNVQLQWRKKESPEKNFLPHAVLAIVGWLRTNIKLFLKEFGDEMNKRHNIDPSVDAKKIEDNPTFLRDIAKLNKSIADLEAMCQKAITIRMERGRVISWLKKLREEYSDMTTSQKTIQEKIRHVVEAIFNICHKIFENKVRIGAIQQRIIRETEKTLKLAPSLEISIPEVHLPAEEF